MRIFALVNSDSLAIPSLIRLSEQGLLAGIGLVESSSDFLIPKIKGVSITAPIFVLNKANWVNCIEKALISTNASTVFIFTFPWILPNQLLENNLAGFYNIHFGLLPKYAGADPIFWQIKNHEKYGGITVHKVTEEIDAGPVIIQKQIQIMEGENYGFHCYRLGMFCAEIFSEIIETLNSKIMDAPIKTEENVKYWKKPAESDLTIDWERMEADEIEWLVNAANPKYGGAISTIGNATILIKEVTPVNMDQDIKADPGTVVFSDSVYGIIVACFNGGFLRITIAEINEGVVSGVKLSNMGIHNGYRFGLISNPIASL